MSLIIAANVPDGIIIGSDECRQMKNTNNTNSRVKFNENVIKIVVWPERMVVGHCGDTYLCDDETAPVHDFLQDNEDLAQNSHGCITSIPLTLLNRFHNKHAPTQYKISLTSILLCGFDEYNNGVIYNIGIQSAEINMVNKIKTYTATAIGVPYIAREILRGARWESMGLMEAACLIRTAIEATGLSQKYGFQERTVSVANDIYIIPRDKRIEGGWFNGPKLFGLERRDKAWKSEHPQTIYNSDDVVNEE